MRNRSGKEIRELFIEFWKEKGAARYPSFSLIPDDPSLLFTIAGMVPFKKYYLGLSTPPSQSAVTCQKCVRTNDIENVGRTARHHTFFEMLGNFSWGGYFKKEAVAWSWEFLTTRIGLDPSRLYASIYKDDSEAYDAWRNIAGLPEERIKRFGMDENYWFMSETGPCGPCSEIYYDRGEKYGCDRPDCGVGCDCDRYMEIWNLVFTQYDRQKDGSLLPLPRNNIDTGMGLERLTSVVQGVDTDYETDLFMPLIEYTCKRANVSYGSSAKNDLAVRVIVDHIRAVIFMLSDGVLPSNDGPGYVLRRLLRRAARYGRLLGFEGGFLREYMPALLDIMGDAYPDLVENRAAIEKIIDVEETRFDKTLSQGMDIFDSAVELLRSSGAFETGGENVLSGDVAFTLYDTFGFPFELTCEMAAEEGINVDKAGFDKAMQAQRERARAGSKQKKTSLAGDVYTELANDIPATVFTGYDRCADEGKIVAIISGGVLVDSIDKRGAEFELVLTITPFYAERGGEVGDTGTIKTSGAEMEVLNVTPKGGLSVHSVRLLSGSVTVGEEARAEVDNERRSAVRRNHSATHLLHEALSRVLGSHVRQAGSLVNDALLRFDFTHHEAMTQAQAEEAENIVNEQILANRQLIIGEYDREEARALGAKALFDEKYGSVVRVVSVPGFSVELCGGLHVNATGDIGLFKITREEGIGSGTRRITAVTGLNSLKTMQDETLLMSRVFGVLAADETNVESRLEDILSENKRLQRTIKEIQAKELALRAGDVFVKKEIKGLTLLTGKFSGSGVDSLRELGDGAKAKHSPVVVVMASVQESGDCALLVMADDAAVEMGVNAGTLVKEGAALLGGRGGGKANTAQGGGKDAGRLDDVLTKIESLLNAL
ncbi:alanine--tRNA ligase [Synergistales bacterium]|nr:alanine--tRNA ligase [Synergistales bacterium]